MAINDAATVLAAALSETLEVMTDAVAARVIERMNSRGSEGEPALLSVKDAGRYIGRTGPALRAMITTGEIPETIVKRIGPRVFLTRKGLDAWIKAH